MDIFAELEKMEPADLREVIRHCERQIKTFEARQKAKALAAAEEAAQAHGFSLKDLTGRKAEAGAGPAKYRNPENSAETWTGRGRRPRWFLAAIEAGKSEEDLKV